MTLDCSTPGKKIQANVDLHDYLTQEVREEEQRDVVRDLARAVGVDFEGPRRKTLMNWDEVRTDRARIRSSPSARIR